MQAYSCKNLKIYAPIKEKLNELAIMYSSVISTQYRDSRFQKNTLFRKTKNKKVIKHIDLGFNYCVLEQDILNRSCQEIFDKYLKFYAEEVGKYIDRLMDDMTDNKKLYFLKPIYEEPFINDVSNIRGFVPVRVIYGTVFGNNEHFLQTKIECQILTNRRNKMSKPKLGSGGRFKVLTTKLKKEGKSDEAAKAIAASAGRKKYGNTKMSAMAAKGKKK